jgi:uncharacterized membrane protein
VKKAKIGSYILVALCVAFVIFGTIFFYKAFSTIIEPRNFFATFGEILASFLVSCTIASVAILFIDIHKN